MPKVFISFVHEDGDVAEAVQRLLSETVEDLKYEVFLSSNQVTAGKFWLEEIKKALAASRVVVAMLSQRSIKRPWVNFEAGAAWLAGKTLLPCCFGSLSKNALPAPYSLIQAVDLSSEPEQFVLSVRHYIGFKAASSVDDALKFVAERENLYGNLKRALRDFKDDGR